LTVDSVIFLQAWMPLCHSTNSIKALQD